jgi:hypothetical protein
MSKMPPDDTTVCTPVIGSTLKTAPAPPNALGSTTYKSPLAAIAMCFGSAKSPPEETTV